MSYAGKELTVQESSPVMLFYFAQSGLEYRYTTLGLSISRSGSTWSPVALTCSSVGSTSEVPKDNITIELPWLDPLALTFVKGTLEVVTTVTVFRTHWDDTEVRTVWMGRVVNSMMGGATVKLTCEPISSTLRRKIAARTFSRTCPYVFGATGTCNFDTSTVTTTETATVANGSVVTVPSASGLTKIEGGTLSYGGIKRMIIDHAGTLLTLMRPNAALALALAGHPEGVSVDICQACSHELDDLDIGCRARGNAGNFGGWPGIPVKNPMSNSLTVTDT